MATPNEQHAARGGRARVVGSANLDGRQPLAEAPPAPDESSESERTDPSSPAVNPLGLGPRGRESSNTGSAADTSYDAQGADPYTTGEPRKDFGGADAETPSSDEP